MATEQETVRQAGRRRSGVSTEQETMARLWAEVQSETDTYTRVKVRAASKWDYFPGPIPDFDIFTDQESSLVYTPGVTKTFTLFALKGILAHELGHGEQPMEEQLDLISEGRSAEREDFADRWAALRGYGPNNIEALETIDRVYDTGDFIARVIPGQEHLPHEVRIANFRKWDAEYRSAKHSVETGRGASAS